MATEIRFDHQGYRLIAPAATVYATRALAHAALGSQSDGERVRQLTSDRFQAWRFVAAEDGGGPFTTLAAAKAGVVAFEAD